MKHLPVNIKYIFCLLLLIANSYSLVHKFKANKAQLSPEAAIARKHHFNSVLNDQNREAFVRRTKIERKLKKYHRGELSSVGVSELNYILIGNISVGTPSQTFAVEFDPFYTRDFNLIDSEADVKAYGDIPPKKTFNSSASSTYIKQDGDFTYEGTGYKAKDTVNIRSLPTTMTFGILDKVGYRYQREPVDGILGLHLSPSLNNMTNAAVQLVSQLDKPVISVWINSTDSGSGSAQFTFGAEDTDHCDSTSGYVPLIDMGYSFGFHLSAATVCVNGVNVSVGMNDTVHFVPWQEYIYCERNFLDILVNASGAVYNTTYSRYHVDCAAKTGGQVSLNMGGKDDTTNDGSNRLLLTGADYIKYDIRSKSCYLMAISAAWYQGFVELGMNFLKNHCFSYNVHEKTVAFSNVR